MKNFAQIDENNIVVNVILTNDDFNQEGFIEYTSNKLAMIGFTYDAVRDAFIAPRPDNAIGFDEVTCSWILPERE